jgi:hypothetical protein
MLPNINIFAGNILTNKAHLRPKRENKTNQ